MKLQVKFKVENPDGTYKQVTKTFSTINEEVSNQDYKDFALAYTSLVDATELEVYLVTVEEL